MAWLTSPTNKRGSHPLWVGLTEEVQMQGNPRRGKIEKWHWQNSSKKFQFLIRSKSLFNLA